MPKNTVQALELESIASSILGVSYQAINPNGTEGACFFLRIVNNSDKDVTISYDKTKDNEFIPAHTTFEIGTQTNAQPRNQVCLFPKGMVVWVKGTAGSGNIYLTGYYQE